MIEFRYDDQKRLEILSVLGDLPNRSAIFQELQTSQSRDNDLRIDDPAEAARRTLIYSLEAYAAQILEEMVAADRNGVAVLPSNLERKELLFSISKTAGRLSEFIRQAKAAGIGVDLPILFPAKNPDPFRDYFTEGLVELESSALDAMDLDGPEQRTKLRFRNKLAAHALDNFSFEKRPKATAAGDAVKYLLAVVNPVMMRAREIGVLWASPFSDVTTGGTDNATGGKNVERFIKDYLDGRFKDPDDGYHEDADCLEN